MNKQCKEAGHMFDVIDSDKNYTFEQCCVCGYKERFCNHDNRQYYKETHQADTMQVWDKRFAMLYPEAVARKKQEEKELYNSEQEANDKLDQAKHAFKRTILTSKFVH